MTRANERGSVVGFVVVGILLTALVVGGIYVVKNKLAGHLDGQTADQAAKEVASNTEKSNSDTQTSQPEDKSTDNKEQQTTTPSPTAEQESSSQQSQTSTTEQQSSSTSQSSGSTDSSTSSTSTEQSSNLPHTGMEVAQLPQTGAADFVASAAGIGILVGSILVYRRSSQL